MKICVVGAGAIGGLIACRLHHAGEDVEVVARGAQLRAIRERGLIVQEADGHESIALLKATDVISDVGPTNLLILAVKAHQVSGLVHELAPLVGEQTLVMTAQNGIPWWYFSKHGGPHEGRRLETVDPGGLIADNLPIDRVIASIVYPAAEVVEPGRIKHIEGNRLSLAELDESRSTRIEGVAEVFRKAGFKAPVVTGVRAELWLKLWGNLSFNPISALTHATLDDLCRYPPSRQLVGEMMSEAQAVGEALEVRFRIPLEKRIAGGEAVGGHKTSMLQDVEAGRLMETEALLGSVIELGRITQVPTPHSTLCTLS